MHQILFHVPFTAGWFPPDGIPLHGFGAMLFICFVITAMWWGPKRAVQIGLPKERLQDMAILLFVAGIAGARVVYIWQYYDRDFKGKNLLVEFFKIWEGGIVFYGSAIGAVIGFLAFRHFVLKKLGVSTFKLMDVIAPLIAFGLAVGRIGCYLNGCCWGQVAVPESQPVPLVAELGQYPLLSGHGVREQVTTPPNSSTQLPQVWGLQTAVGFTYATYRDQDGKLKVEVDRLERGSAAAEALKKGDVILSVNGVEVGPMADQLDPSHWPRWKKSLELEIERGGKKQGVTFTPRTVSVFPTQLYEVVSMGLLTVLLLAFQPFRRHDGQLMVLLMIGYGVHRWFNEAIRIEPTYAMGMTLSQWISLAIILGGLVLEVYLRKVQAPLPKGPLPLSHGAVPLPPPVAK